MPKSRVRKKKGKKVKYRPQNTKGIKSSQFENLMNLMRIKGDSEFLDITQDIQEIIGNEEEYSDDLMIEDMADEIYLYDSPEDEDIEKESENTSDNK